MKKAIALLLASGFLAPPALAGGGGLAALQAMAWFTPERIGFLLAFMGVSLVGRGLRMRGTRRAAGEEARPVQVIVLHAGNLPGLGSGAQPSLLDSASIRLLSGM